MNLRSGFLLVVSRWYGYMA